MDDTGVDFSQLPRGEYGFPGPLRDRLVAAIVAGEKITTSSLVVEYEQLELSLPVVGDREVVVDSAGQPVCITEVVGMHICPCAQVSLSHVIGEGEGFATVEQWRDAHREFWESKEFRTALGRDDFRLEANTEVVCVEFQVIWRV